MTEKWMQKLDLKKNALRKSLGVKAGEKISEKKLKIVEKSKNPLTRKRANLAEIFRNSKH